MEKWPRTLMHDLASRLLRTAAVSLLLWWTAGGI